MRGLVPSGASTDELAAQSWSTLRRLAFGFALTGPSYACSSVVKSMMCAMRGKKGYLMDELAVSVSPEAGPVRHGSHTGLFFLLLSLAVEKLSRLQRGNVREKANDKRMAFSLHCAPHHLAVNVANRCEPIWLVYDLRNNKHAINQQKDVKRLTAAMHLPLTARLLFHGRDERSLICFSCKFRHIVHPCKRASTWAFGVSTDPVPHK